MPNKKKILVFSILLIVLSIVPIGASTRTYFADDKVIASDNTTETEVSTENATFVEPDATETDTTDVTSEETDITTESESKSETTADVNTETKLESKEPTNEPTKEPTVEPTKEPEKTKPAFTVTPSDTITMYAKASVNVRKGPSTDYDKLGTLSYGEAVKVTGTADTGWYQITYKSSTGYVSDNYLVKTKPESNQVSNNSFPLTYSDSTCNITIEKEKYEGTWCYIAHVTFSDYTRFGSSCANNKYGGYETTSHAASRLNAILCINGDYASPDLNYHVARSGVVMNDGATWCEGIYSRNTGVLAYRDSLGVGGKQLSDLVNDGTVSDTFQFGPAFLIDGNVQGSNGGGRAQRTFLGTNGNAGDIYLVVSDGRYNDGVSAGLTAYECATLLKSKGCTFGVPLDGGGSSTMVFQGKVVNAVTSQRKVVDFVYFK